MSKKHDSNLTSQTEMDELGVDVNEQPVQQVESSSEEKTVDNKVQNNQEVKITKTAKEQKKEQVKDAESKKKKKKDNKQNVVVKKTKETVSELKKVSWPSFSKVVKKTGVVIAVMLIFTVVLFGIDRLLALLFNLFTSALG